MSDDIAVLLDELHQDHRNMAFLLELLERESNRLFDGGTPDFELMHDIMLYMTGYPDAVHHPKEDRLYAEVKEVRPELTAGFQRISHDHREIGEQGRKARDQLALIQSGNFVDRKSIVADLLRYVHALRSHMQWEELDLFRRCRTMAEDGHKFLEHSGGTERGDPLFGRQVEATFERLLRQIQSSGTER